MIIHGDSIDELKSLESGSIDAVVTDPPYGLSALSPAQVADVMLKWCRGDLDYMPTGAGFMGKSWDVFVPPPALWVEVMRVLKPGGHALVFAASRSQDLMGLSLRLAGFEMRDVIQWIYGTGFPKSLNVSKAIDGGLGVEREVIGFKKVVPGVTFSSDGPSEMPLTLPASDEARQWEGWGTALKPAYEPCLLVRKPIKGTVAGNVVRYGAGALNIDGCRIGEEIIKTHGGGTRAIEFLGADTTAYEGSEHRGRWPSNVIFDEESAPTLGDQSRFFYCAKASRGEREAGLGGFDLKKAGAMSGEETRSDRPTNHPMRANVHPTVKPIDLMRYLIRLITPKGGTVLDPFNGSGSTGCAAALERVDYIGIEREAEYVEISRARIAHWSGNPIIYETPKPKSEEIDLFNWREQHD